tara:strand:- start:1199 stop:1627 length:429 start_codon:yes stop_codon:yes gene_type:complete
VSTESGDAISEAFAEHFEKHPLHQALGVRLEARQEDFARISIAPSEVTQGGIGGSLHGGVLAALVDIVMLAALSTVQSEGKHPAGTADLNITYLRPALGKLIYAEGTVVKRGQQLAMIEVSILDEQGRLCAKGRTLYAFRKA